MSALLHVSLVTHADLSGGIGRFSSLSVSVCLSVCLQHKSKTNDPKVSDLVGLAWEMTFGSSDMIWGLAGQRSRSLSQ